MAEGAYLRGAEYAVRCPRVFTPQRHILTDILLDIGRMVQGNNQSLGSPVNRIKITGYWASRSLVSSPNLTLPQRVREYWYYVLFRGVMLSLDVVFWTNRVKGWVRRKMGLMSEGFEDELERSMRGFAKSNLGVDVAADAFDG